MNKSKILSRLEKSPQGKSRVIDIVNTTLVLDAHTLFSGNEKLLAGSELEKYFATQSGGLFFKASFWLGSAGLDAELGLILPDKTYPSIDAVHNAKSVDDWECWAALAIQTTPAESSSPNTPKAEVKIFFENNTFFDEYPLQIVRTIILDEPLSLFSDDDLLAATASFLSRIESDIGLVDVLPPEST